MFKNHEVRIRLEKTKPHSAADSIPESNDLDPGRISILVAQNVDHIAKLVGIGIAGTYALHTASEIAIHIAKTKIK